MVRFGLYTICRKVLYTQSSVYSFVFILVFPLAVLMRHHLHTPADRTSFAWNLIVPPSDLSVQSYTFLTYHLAKKPPYQTRAPQYFSLYRSFAYDSRSFLSHLSQQPSPNSFSISIASSDYVVFFRKITLYIDIGFFNLWIFWRNITVREFDIIV